MKYLGIDYGKAYIGLAVGDDESNLALPFDTIRETNVDRQLSVIEQIVLDEGIDMVIIGYPLTLEGGESEQTAETMSFLTELSGKISIPVDKEDERLTSQFAQALEKEAEGEGLHDEHALAAVGILQTYLDRQAGN
jgi:putative Holliday junction resolvase